MVPNALGFVVIEFNVVVGTFEAEIVVVVVVVVVVDFAVVGSTSTVVAICDVAFVGLFINELMVLDTGLKISTSLLSGRIDFPELFLTND